MFERFTEKARRVIFFARYEASQYGSQSIETEHMLLGLLRQDNRLRMRLLGRPGAVERIRKEIEDRITRGERVSTSVEMPISSECKQALNFAAEEAERLAHQYVGTEHIILGLLRVEKSLAAAILTAHKITLGGFRDFLANGGAEEPATGHSVAAHSDFEKTTLLLQNFLEALRAGLTEDSREFFTLDAQYIDLCGTRSAGEKELHSRLAELFAPFAARNVKCKIVESTRVGEEMCVASLLCEDVPFAGKPPKGQCWMTIVLGWESWPTGQWAIHSIQVTPVTRI
jgi:Clp amino terminal domain, pathogenicity island component